MEDKKRLSSGQIKSKAKKALKGNWGTAVITFLIFNIIMHSVTYVYNGNELVNYMNQPHTMSQNVHFGSTGITFIISLFLAGPMTYGIRRFCMNLVRDKSHKIENIFEGFKHFGGTFIVNIILGIYSFMWSLMVIVSFIIIVFVMTFSLGKINGGIYNYTGDELNGYIIAILILLIIALIIALSMILFRYAMTYYIYIDNSDIGAMEAIKESVSIMKGNKTRLFLLYLSFIHWYILGIITIGIGFLWIIPYIDTSVAIFYDELKANKEYNAEEAISTV